MRQLWIIIKATRGLLLSFSALLVVAFIASTFIAASRQFSYTKVTANLLDVKEDKSVRDDGTVERKQTLTLQLPGAQVDGETSAPQINLVPEHYSTKYNVGDPVAILLAPDKKSAILDSIPEIYSIPIVTLIFSFITGITAFGMYRFTREPTEAELAEANTFISRKMALAFGIMIALSSVFFIVLMVFLISRG